MPPIVGSDNSIVHLLYGKCHFTVSLWQISLWQLSLWQIWCVHLILGKFAWLAIRYWVQTGWLLFEVLGFIDSCKFPFMQLSVLANNRLEIVYACKCLSWQMSIVANRPTANWWLQSGFVQLSVTLSKYVLVHNVLHGIGPRSPPIDKTLMIFFW